MGITQPGTTTVLIAQCGVWTGSISFEEWKVTLSRKTDGVTAERISLSDLLGNSNSAALVLNTRASTIHSGSGPSSSTGTDKYDHPFQSIRGRIPRHRSRHSEARPFDGRSFKQSVLLVLERPSSKHGHSYIVRDGSYDPASSCRSRSTVRRQVN